MVWVGVFWCCSLIWCGGVGFGVEVEVEEEVVVVVV